MRPRVREGQLGVVAALVADGQEVDVQRARAPADLAHPAGGVLQLVGEVQQGPCIQVGVHEDHRIEVVGLLRTAHGCGAPQAGHPVHRDIGVRGQAGHCRAQRRPRVAEVGAERQGSAGHRALVMLTDTSSKGTGMGACGLCTVTFTART